MSAAGCKEEECSQKSLHRTRPNTDLRAVVETLRSPLVRLEMDEEERLEAINFYEEHIRRTDKLERDCTAIGEALLRKIRGEVKDDDDGDD